MGIISRLIGTNANSDARQTDSSSGLTDQSWVDDVALGTHVSLALKSGSTLSGTLEARDKKSITVASSVGGMRIVLDRRDVLPPQSRSQDHDEKPESIVAPAISFDEEMNVLLNKAGMKAGTIKVFKPEHFWGIILGDDGVEYSFIKNNVSDEGLESALALGLLHSISSRVAFVPGIHKKKDGSVRPIATEVIRESELLARLTPNDERNNVSAEELCAGDKASDGANSALDSSDEQVGSGFNASLVEAGFTNGVLKILSDQGFSSMSEIQTVFSADPSSFLRIKGINKDGFEEISEKVLLFITLGSLCSSAACTRSNALAYLAADIIPQPKYDFDKQEAYVPDFDEASSAAALAMITPDDRPEDNKLDKRDNQPDSHESQSLRHAEANRLYGSTGTRGQAIVIYRELIDEGFVSPLALRRTAERYASAGMLSEAVTLLKGREGWFDSRPDYLKTISSVCNKGGDYKGVVAAKLELMDYEKAPRKRLTLLQDVIKQQLTHGEYEDAFKHCAQWESIKEKCWEGLGTTQQQKMQKRQGYVFGFAKECVEKLGYCPDPTVLDKLSVNLLDPVDSSKNGSRANTSALNGRNEPKKLSKNQESQAIREGQQAFRKKDFKTAEKQFLLLFDEGSSAAINSVVGDYVSMCIQIEGKATNAAAILDGHKQDIEPNKFRNLSIMVYEKIKDYEKLVPLYQEAFQLGTSGNQGKSHALRRMIDALITLHRYAEGLAACRQWISFCEQCRYDSSYRRISGGRTDVRRKEAICLYQLKQVEEAKTIAGELILDNPSDQIARKILEETLEADSKAMAPSDGSIAGLFDGTEEVSFEVITNPFVLEQIQSVDIGSQIKYRVTNGVYTGSIEDAQKVISALLSEKTQSDKIRAESRFIVCSLIAQMKSKHTDCPKYWTDSFVKAQSAHAMASWGHSKVSIGQLDTSRMAYLYSIEMLGHDDPDWRNAINCYLKSYVLGADITVFIEQIRRKASNFEPGFINADELPEIVLPVYTIGFLDLLNALSDKPEQRDALLKGMFTNNENLSKRICAQIGTLFGEAVTIESLADFKALLNRASTSVLAQNRLLEQNLSKIASVFMSSALSDELLESIEPSAWRKWINNSDFERLRKLQEALIRSQAFFETADFDGRAEALRSSMQDLGLLRELISSQPTALSFDVLLPFIDVCINHLIKERSDLYADNQPELSFEEAAPAVLTPEGGIFVQLRVSNGKGCQTAKHIVFDKDCAISEEVLSVEGFAEIDQLQGGSTSDVVMTASVSDTVRASGSFTLKLKIDFTSQDDGQGSSIKAYEDEITIVIANDDYEPLKNPYAAYEGNIIAADNDSMFYGREADIEEMVGKLQDSSTDHMIAHGAVVLYGQTRAGKSSLMAQIRNAAIRKYGDSILVCNYGNALDAGSSADDPDIFLAQFLYQMLDICCDAAISNSRISDQFDYESFQPPYEMLADPSYAMSIFKSKMRKLSSILESEDILLVLFIDEFTDIYTLMKCGEVSPHFMKFWKSLLQNYFLFAVVVGQDHMPEFISEYENEFYCMEPRLVSYLDEASAKRLIREPLERENGRTGLFQDDAVDEVFRLTAGSAYLTMIVCSKLVSYLNERGAPVVTKGLVGDFLNRRAFGPNGFLKRGNFESMIRERGHEELIEENEAILHAIARQCRLSRAVEVSKIDCPEIEPERLASLVRRLVNRDVLIKDKGMVEIKVKLFERWLLETMGE